MKRIILMAAILFAGFAIAKAQAPTATDNTTLKVKLNAIQTLVVNSAQKNVILDYITTDNYNDGVESLQEDHLKVYSTGAFHVQVASASDQIANASATDIIEAANLKVTSTLGTTNKLTGATVGEVSLSTTATDIISSDLGGVDRNFNITYAGLGGNGYVNNYISTENPTVYTTTVTYTIAAK